MDGFEPKLSSLHAFRLLLQLLCYNYCPYDYYSKFLVQRVGLRASRMLLMRRTWVRILFQVSSVALVYKVAALKS